jgi:hypothetical protein
MSTKQEIQAVKAALSTARMSTYDTAANIAGDDDPKALTLYAWNAQISGAFLAPLHVCEVVIRNAISEAIEMKYGDKWPWSPGFEQSLPDPLRGYSPRKDLHSARRSAPTTGKVIPELKFVFWQKMFTARYDARIWDDHLKTVLPNADKAKDVAVLRAEIYDSLAVIRTVRNRIAHHEPIFQRNLKSDFDTVSLVIGLRCQTTLTWMQKNQDFSGFLTKKPK